MLFLLLNLIVFNHINLLFSCISSKPCRNWLRSLILDIGNGAHTWRRNRLSVLTEYAFVYLWSGIIEKVTLNEFLLESFCVLFKLFLCWLNSSFFCSEFFRFLKLRLNRCSSGSFNFFKLYLYVWISLLSLLRFFTEFFNFSKPNIFLFFKKFFLLFFFNL